MNQPSRVLQQIPLYDLRHRAAIIAHSDVGPPQLVLVCNLLQGFQNFILTCKAEAKEYQLYTDSTYLFHLLRDYQNFIKVLTLPNACCIFSENKK